MGLPGVTSLNHVTVALPKIGAAIASRSDGTRTSAELTAWLAAEIAAGRIALPEPAPGDAEAVLDLARRHVTDTLRQLADSAVLVPAAP